LIAIKRKEFVRESLFLQDRKALFMNVRIINYLFGTQAITEEAIRDFVADANVKRICFSRIPTQALWKT
jgi:hypothetical protein